jgi:protease I
MELQGRRIALLAENDYEDPELWYPYYRLKEAGAQVTVVGTGSAQTYNSKHGYPVKVDANADQVDARDFDGVVIPGGWAPDRMRRYPAVLQLVRDADAQGKVVGAICHAGWVLCSARIVKGRTVTSVPAIKDDLINAGANWVDQEVVRDGRLVTSRVPADLPAFCRELIGALASVEAPALARR